MAPKDQAPNPTPIPTSTTTTTTTITAIKGQQKYHELATCTIRAPTYSYAHLELQHQHQHQHQHPASTAEQLDALQTKTYCAAALRQFLGDAGAAVAESLDVLHVEAPAPRCFVRVPRDDLAAFAAALAAWQGVSDGGGDGGGGRATLRILGCSDWLGTLLARPGEDRVWSSSGRLAGVGTGAG